MACGWRRSPGPGTRQLQQVGDVSTRWAADAGGRKRKGRTEKRELLRLSLRHVHPRHSCVALSLELQAARAESQRRRQRRWQKGSGRDAAAGRNHSTAPSGRQGARGPVSCVLLGNGGGLASEAAYQLGDKRSGQGCTGHWGLGGGPKSGVHRCLVALAGLTTLCGGSSRHMQQSPGLAPGRDPGPALSTTCLLSDRYLGFFEEGTSRLLNGQKESIYQANIARDSKPAFSLGFRPPR